MFLKMNLNIFDLYRTLKDKKNRSYSYVCPQKLPRLDFRLRPISGVVQTAATKSPEVTSETYVNINKL